MGKAQAKPEPVRLGESLTARRLHAAQIRAETASPPSTRKGRHRCPCRTCSATQSAGALASSDRLGGTASPPSAGIPGTEDCAPPRSLVGGTASSRSARTSGALKSALPQGPLATEPSRSAGKGRPRRPLPNGRPTPWPGDRSDSDRSGGTASPPSARISGIEHCAPTGKSDGRDLIPAVSSNAPTISC
jgi:hypothetical protein